MMSHPIVYGAIDGVPVAGNCPPGALAATRTVTLKAAYRRSPPADYPRPDPGAPAAASLTATPRTIPAGTTLTLFSDEAEALIAAGFATAA